MPCSPYGSPSSSMSHFFRSSFLVHSSSLVCLCHFLPLRYRSIPSSRTTSNRYSSMRAARSLRASVSWLCCLHCVLAIKKEKPRVRKAHSYVGHFMPPPRSTLAPHAAARESLQLSLPWLRAVLPHLSGCCL